MKDVEKYYEQDAFARLVGVELVEAHDGFARARMKITPHHLNAQGTVQGGALVTLTALAFVAAASAAGPPAVGVNMSITCVKAVDSGVLYAEAVETARSRRLSHCTVRLTDEEGTLIAQFQGTACITGDV